MSNETLFHVIKDPVHGTMQFTTTEYRWIQPFIDSPNFQRLRHIKQLGMGDFIFPGAVHTRFNHCIGCCYVANQIARKIGLSDADHQLVIVACLLHDIGHGPFSHAFEASFHAGKIRHEAWTPFFLADYKTPEFFAEYNRINSRHPLTEEKFQQIENMIMHKASAKQLLADIVSSQLDADRLDYLLRDSHFCGVNYGEFDLRWMLNSLAVVDSANSKRLGLTYKGIGGVEHYLMARRLMTRNIYHHKKKLALEFLLVKLLSVLASSIEDYAPFTELKTTRLGSFLLALKTFNETITAVPDKAAARLKFLQDNYKNYKELCDYDVFAAIRFLAELQSSHPAVQLASRLQLRIIPKIIHIDHLPLETAQHMIQEFQQAHLDKFQDWQFSLITTPHQSYSNELDPILVANEHGFAKPLNELSTMVDAMSDKYEHTAFLCIDRAIHKDAAIAKFVEKLLKA